jgi:hypothetical protein
MCSSSRTKEAVKNITSKISAMSMKNFLYFTFLRKIEDIYYHLVIKSSSTSTVNYNNIKIDLSPNHISKNIKKR